MVLGLLLSKHTSDGSVNFLLPIAYRKLKSASDQRQIQVSVWLEKLVLSFPMSQSGKQKRTWLFYLQ